MFFTLSSSLLFACIPRLIVGCSVDYILFLTADVTVTANVNEIRDHKYVDKAELQAMFEEEGKHANARLDACARQVTADGRFFFR